jgi:O-methyltransferase
MFGKSSKAKQETGYDDLRRELERVNAENRVLAAERDEFRKAIAVLNAGGKPSYEGDSFAVWGRTIGFMKQPRFLDAYKAGIHSGHVFGKQTGRHDDLHIEWRAAVNCWAGHHASRLLGDFVECGTNTGIYSLAICRYLDFNSLNKQFFLFDTFCGIPVEQISEREHELNRSNENRFYPDCWDLVQANFRPYPKVKLVRGKVPDTLSAVDIPRVSYLSIDMNIAKPERAAIEHFWDRLVPGALVVLDDYGFSTRREQKEEMDDFAANRNIPIFELPTGQGLIIKP